MTIPPPAPPGLGAAAAAAANADIRSRFVDRLEYLYGPVLVSLVYGFAFGAVDATQEILIGLGDDLSDWARTVLGLDVRAQCQPEPMSRVGLLFVPWRAAITFASVLAVPYTALTAMRGILKAHAVRIDRPAIVIMALTLWALWLGIALGPLRAAASFEGRQCAAPALLVMAVPGLVGVAVSSLLLVHMLAPLPNSIRTYTRVVRVGAKRRMIQRVFSFVMLFTLAAGFAAPSRAGVLGPIAISSIFACLMILGLAWLTTLSRLSPGGLPPLLAVLALILSVTSPVAAGLTVGLCILVLWNVRPISWGQVVAVTIVGLMALGFALLTSLSRDCDALSGCNMVQGVPKPPDGPASTLVSRNYIDWQFNHGPGRLVAAQGGGLYAAYHTAFFLAARADADPDFAKSVFAISGVSGGSVGATIYWAIRRTGLCEDRPAEDRCHRRAVQFILRNDYLSPALAGLFFRDNIDNLLPISALISVPIDRGRVMERAYETRLTNWIRKEEITTGRTSRLDAPLSLGLTGSWAPEAGAPLLLLNTTEVHSGKLVPLSPVKWIRIGQPGGLSLADGRDLSVATAMVASARFPIVTPPMRLRAAHGATDPDDPTKPAPVLARQIVDGGYFDNSGIETLIDFMPAIVAFRKFFRATPSIPSRFLSLRTGTAILKPPGTGTATLESFVRPPVEVIALSVREVGECEATAALARMRRELASLTTGGGVTADDDGCQPGRPADTEVKGTFGAPLAAFTNAWRARRSLTEVRLSTAFPTPLGSTPEVCVLNMELLEPPGGFTVSWFLSGRTFRRIETQVEHHVATRRDCYDRGAAGRP